jgi:hypothetical protein
MPAFSTVCQASITSLVFARQIIVVFPYDHISGGPAALHHVHSSINRNDIAESVFCTLNAHYADTHSVSITTAEIFAGGSVSSKDIFLMPSDWGSWTDERWTHDELTKLRSNGARAVSYVLGICSPHEQHVSPLEEKTMGGVIPFAHSHYTHEIYGLPWHDRDGVLLSPLEPSIYAAAREYSMLPLDQRVPKEALVLVDGDFKSDVQIPNIPNVEVKVLKGLSKTEIIDFYKRARVVVDIFLNGLERVACEGVLFDALPVLAAADNGKDDIDFPIPGEFKVDPLDPDAMSAVILRILFQHEQLVGHFAPFKQMVQRMPAKSDAAVESIFSSSKLQFAIHVGNYASEQHVWASVLSILALLPLASIDIFVRGGEGLGGPGSTALFLRQSHVVLEELASLGLTDRKGGGSYHSIRVRVEPDQIESKPRALSLMPTVVHGDVFLLLPSPALLFDKEPLVRAATALDLSISTDSECTTKQLAFSVPGVAGLCVLTDGQWVSSHMMEHVAEGEELPGFAGFEIPVDVADGALCVSLEALANSRIGRVTKVFDQYYKQCNEARH